MDVLELTMICIIVASTQIKASATYHVFCVCFSIWAKIKVNFAAKRVSYHLLHNMSCLNESDMWEL